MKIKEACKICNDCQFYYDFETESMEVCECDA